MSIFPCKTFSVLGVAGGSEQDVTRSACAGDHQRPWADGEGRDGQRARGERHRHAVEHTGNVPSNVQV